MREDDFIKLIGPENQETIKGAVLVLNALREMDADRLSRLLAQVRLAKPIFPKEMAGVIEALEADFTLVIAFIDQAKKYDRSHKINWEVVDGPKTDG
jgi:hypothetical protein